MLKLNFRPEQFDWHKPASRRQGYEWQGNRLALPDGAATKKYRVDKARVDKALYLTFAALPETEEAFRGFANKYGPLGEPLEACTLDIWRSQVKLMKRLVALAEALKSGDWKGVCGKLEPKPFWSMSHEKMVERAVAELLSPALPTLRCLEAVPSLDERAGTVGLRLGYGNLMNFMWFQFIHSLVGHAEPRQCEACGDYFTARRGSKTCSATCRVQLSRTRKRAREVYAKGMGVRQIAKELPADIALVKKWIATK